MSFQRSVSRRTARLALALASVLVFVLVFAGVVSALTAGNVDGVWRNPTPSNPEDFRWCYAGDNTSAPAGDPTSCSSSNAGIQNGPNSTLSDENQVRYGDPAVGYGNPNRSGFGFNGNNDVGAILADTPFYLGRFTHYNRPIYADPVLTDISIDVTVGGILCDDNSVPTEGSSQTFTYDVTLDETNNNPANWPNNRCPYGMTMPYNNPDGGCDDKVTISQQPDTVFNCPEGERTVQILGFVPGAGCHLAYSGSTTNAFVTAESSQNEACLWARISDPTNPLAVTLASFEATGQTDRVVLTWETVSELQNAGFNLYRSANDYEVGERINAELIPSQAPGSAQGFAYQFNDLDVTPGQTYWYTLEDVALAGGTALHGPVSATVLTPTAVTLSDMRAASATSPSLLIALAAAALGITVFGAFALRQRRNV